MICAQGPGLRDVADYRKDGYTIQRRTSHVAPRLTEQDPRMVPGAMVFDCCPVVLPVSVGIDTVRCAEPPAEPVVAARGT